MLHFIRRKGHANLLYAFICKNQRFISGSYNNKSVPLIETFRDIVPIIFLVFRNDSINPSCIIYCKHTIISFELVFNVPESVVRDTFNGLFGGFNYSENKFDGFAVYTGYVFLLAVLLFKYLQLLCMNLTNAHQTRLQVRPHNSLKLKFQVILCFKHTGNNQIL